MLTRHMAIPMEGRRTRQPIFPHFRWTRTATRTDYDFLRSFLSLLPANVGVEGARTAAVRATFRRLVGVCLSSVFDPERVAFVSPAQRAGTTARLPNSSTLKGSHSFLPHAEELHPFRVHSLLPSL